MGTYQTDEETNSLFELNPTPVPNSQDPKPQSKWQYITYREHTGCAGVGLRRARGKLEVSCAVIMVRVSGSKVSIQ